MQRQIFFVAMSMSQKRITSFFTETDSSKRKFSDNENKTAKKLAAKSIAIENISYYRIMTEEEIKQGKRLVPPYPPCLSFAVGKTWLQALKKEFDSDYFKKLGDLLLREKGTIYPPKSDIFSWTTSIEITDVKVVILGQDPYIRPNQAHGLAFSVRKDVDIPKSLINIYAELAKDLPGFVRPTHGCLIGWARQGVLLLNTCLTVRAGQSDSHKNLGWEVFTDAVIKWINDNLEDVVFLLWGNNAKVKSQLISKDKHLVLTAAHPSPLSASRGFFGCRHFSKANNYLKKHGKEEIDWSYLP